MAIPLYPVNSPFVSIQARSIPPVMRIGFDRQ
jgi:hypothetical protein